jgi:hypothetical protein
MNANFTRSDNEISNRESYSTSEFRERPYFLRLINLFFNQRVLGTGFRLILTFGVMARYERLGFFLLMLSVAF